MMEYFKKLFMANQAIFNKGRFIALGMPVVVYPTKMLTRLQKEFIEELGQEGVYEIYESSRDGGRELTKEAMHIAKNSKLLLDFLKKFVPIGGWGLIEVIEEDWTNKKSTFTIKNPSFPKLYGKSDKPICHIVRGLFAGAAATTLQDENIECIETKCVAKGDEFCRFEIRQRQKIEQNDLSKAQIRF